LKSAIRFYQDVSQFTKEPRLKLQIVRRAINAKDNESYRDFFLQHDHRTRGNRPKIFSGMAIEINFRATREPGRKRSENRDRKYFPALLNSHIFSPYFRVPKHSHYFFALQRHILWTLRPTHQPVRLSVQLDIHPVRTRAFSATTKLNVRGLWCAKLRVVICSHEIRTEYVQVHAPRSFMSHASAANDPHGASLWDRTSFEWDPLGIMRGDYNLARKISYVVLLQL